MTLFLRRFILLVALLTGLFFVAAPYVVPMMIERVVWQQFAERVAGTLTVGKISFNPISLRINVRDVSIEDGDGLEVIGLKRLLLDLSWASLWRDETEVQKITLDEPKVLLAVDRDGRSSIAGLFGSDEEQASQLGSNSVRVKVGGVEIVNAQIIYQSETGKQASLKGVSLKLGGFSTEGLKALRLDDFTAQVGEGSVKISGSIEPSPLALKLSVEATDVAAEEALAFVDLGAFQPLSAKASGLVEISFADAVDVKASLALKDIKLRGDDQLEEMQADAAVIDALHYDSAGSTLSIQSVSLSQPRVMVVRPSPGEDDTEESIAELVTRIARLRVDNGTFLFRDDKLKATPLPFTSVHGNLTDIEVGYVLAANLVVDAQVDGVSPLTANGQFSLGSYLDANARLVVDKLDHKWLSPYARSILGRETNAGAAHLEFDYLVEIDEIDGLNTMVFNNWEWGEKNPAYEGDPPPVKKAFDLLESKRKQVHLVIPVEGDVSEPEFKIDALVRRATSKAIGNIVAAPLKLLGSIVGGRKDALDFDKYEFEPSSAELTTLHRSQLSLLAEALAERPKLTLEIDGVAVPGVDLVSDAAVEGAPVDTAGLKKLANQRADAVYQYLIANGVSADRLVRGTRPIGDKKTPGVRIDVKK